MTCPLRRLPELRRIKVPASPRADTLGRMKKTTSAPPRQSPLLSRRREPTPFARRLNRAFLAAFLAPAAAACGSSSGRVASTDSGATVDARSEDSIAPDATPQAEAATTDANRPPADASSGSDGSPSDGGFPEACALDAGLPPGNECTQYAFAPCGYDGGALSSAECMALCPPSDSGLSVLYCGPSGASGQPVLQCGYCGNAGRRPEGLGEAPTAVGVGTFFAQCAWLEAASVHAFRRLARELRALGAPATLVRAATRAAGEEVQHARTMSRIARRHGTEPRRPNVPPMRLRDARSIAHENAVEGCVREAYGALVAKWQAERVRDPALKRRLARIAREEVGHAEIAWQVASWLEPTLASAEREEVERARRAALDELRVTVSQGPASELRDRAGLPSAPEARRLLDALERTVVAPLSRRRRRAAMA
jgi:hypothetical protein